MAEARFGRFRPDGGGIISIFKSEAMVQALKAVADPIGEACEAEASAFATDRMGYDPDDIRIKPMYPHGAKRLNKTAVGYVNVRGLGRINEMEHHSLTSRNH